MKKISIELSRHGIPCLWERGGAGTNTGHAQLIGDKYAQEKMALYIRRRGSLASSDHALIPIKIGDIVVQAYQHRGDFDIDIYQIVSIDIAEKKAELELINDFKQGEWAKNLLPEHEEIVEKAQRKALNYHCRCVYFAKERVKS